MTTTATTYPPGQAPDVYNVGDFILCHRKGFASFCIRLGQKLRYRGEDKKYAFWSHAALITSGDGEIVEALTRGVVRNHIDVYKDTEYTIVHTHAVHLDQLQILRFADKIVGERYGWSTILCCGLKLIFGKYWKFTFGFQGHAVCSGLIARAQERQGAYFELDPSDINPAQLAKYYDVSLVSSEGKPFHRKIAQ